MQQEYGLEGMVAIVTGAARGIGRVYAEALAEAGARVVVSDILNDEGTATAQAITEGGADAFFQPTDVADEAAIEELIAATLDRFGTIDILVNNAALYGGLVHVHDRSGR
jgi:NAD(P)-dependent dehydrogenase (short-subunit alcohol dehydrogenase family)